MEMENLSIDQLRTALSKRGGLKGISGLSGDVRDLEEAALNGNYRASLALDVFVHEIKKYIGAYTAVLEGLDVLVFTGGIGENGIKIREKVCQGLECFGVQIDLQKNQIQGKEALISTEDSSVAILVILANEELVIARETKRLITESS